MNIKSEIKLTLGAIWQTVNGLFLPKSTWREFKIKAYPKGGKRPIHVQQAPPDPRTYAEVKSSANGLTAILETKALGEWDNLNYASALKDSNLTEFDMKHLALLPLKYDIEKYRSLKPFWSSGMRASDAAKKFMVPGTDNQQRGYSSETLSKIFRAFAHAHEEQSKKENKPKI